MASSRLSKDKVQKQMDPQSHEKNNAVTNFNDSLQEDSKQTAGSVNMQNISQTARKMHKGGNNGNSGLQENSIMGPGPSIGPEGNRGSPFAEEESKFLIDKSLLEPSIDQTQPSKISDPIASQRKNMGVKGSVDSTTYNLTNESIEQQQDSLMAPRESKTGNRAQEKSINDHMLMSNDPSMALDSSHMPSHRVMNDNDDSSVKKTPGAITGKHPSLGSNDHLTDQINDKSYEFIHGDSAITQSNGEIVNPNQRKILRKGDGLMKKRARQAMPLANMQIDDVIYPIQTKKGIKFKPTGFNPREHQYYDSGIPNSYLPQFLLQHQANGTGTTVSGAPLNYGGANVDDMTVNPTTPQVGQRTGRILDGFLILHSCRVKLPHEAIVSKLQSKKIFDVIEEDLCYFQNLTELDLSDNRVRFEQLRNLKSLTTLSLQFNNIQVIPYLKSTKDFESLESLNLAYNCLTQDSIRSLYICSSLLKLDLSSNGLEAIPNDLKLFNCLEVLNLSGNKLDSLSNLMNPSLLFKTLGQMPRLKSLNLSRNKLLKIHADMLQSGQDFQQLQELDISQNKIESDQSLWYLLQCQNLNVTVVTGNPFATKKSNYEELELALQKNLAAVLINDSHLVDEHGFYIKTKVQEEAQRNAQLSHVPYPDPIKFERKGQQKSVLGSEATDKFIPGDYLSAEMMKQGIAIQMTDIRPNTNAACEIFPRADSKQQKIAGADESKGEVNAVFTPPDHKQMKFASTVQSSKGVSKAGATTTAAGTTGFGGQQTAGGDDGFFITEDLKHADSADRNSQEENMDPKTVHTRNEVIDEETSEFTTGQKTGTKHQRQHHMDNMDQQTHETDEFEIEDEDDESVFDYGMAKMNFFRARAKQILVDYNEVFEDSDNYSAESQYGMAYEGAPLPMKLCYAQLKNVLKRPMQPIGSHTDTGQVPSYMKPTFTSQRNAAPGASCVILSEMIDKIKQPQGNQYQPLSKTMRPLPNTAPVPFRTITYQQPGQTFDEMLMKTQTGPFGHTGSSLTNKENKVPSKREKEIDNKIERLLVTYKRQDEKAALKATTILQDQERQKRKMLERFGFTADENPADDQEFDLDEEDAKRAAKRQKGISPGRVIGNVQAKQSGNRSKSRIRPMAPIGASSALE